MTFPREFTDDTAVATHYRFITTESQAKSGTSEEQALVEVLISISAV
jgi:hypothetical protein